VGGEGGRELGRRGARKKGAGMSLCFLLKNITCRVSCTRILKYYNNIVHDTMQFTLGICVYIYIYTYIMCYMRTTLRILFGGCVFLFLFFFCNYRASLRTVDGFRGENISIMYNFLPKSHAWSKTPRILFCRFLWFELRARFSRGGSTRYNYKRS